jgi:hypothetical protein
MARETGEPLGGFRPPAGRNDPGVDPGGEGCGKLAGRFSRSAAGGRDWGPRPWFEWGRVLPGESGFVSFVGPGGGCLLRGRNEE